MVIISWGMPGARSLIKTEPPDARRKVTGADISLPASTVVAVQSPARVLSWSNAEFCWAFWSCWRAAATIATASASSTTNIRENFMASPYRVSGRFCQLSGKRHDRPNFHAAKASAWNFSRHGRGRGLVWSFDEVKAAELFLGFGERAVGGQSFAVAHTHGLRGGGRLQGVAALNGSGVLLAEGVILLKFGRIVARREALLVFINQQKKLHLGLLFFELVILPNTRWHVIVVFNGATRTGLEIDRGN